LIVTFAFLHHLAAFVLVAMLTVELVLLRQPITAENATRIGIIDGVMGASAGLLLVVGLLRVFFFEKGWDYYVSSHAFLTKFALFVLIALASIIPTIEFLKWRKAVKAGRSPDADPKKVQTIRKIVHWELVGVVLILFFAAMMARGGFV
jgi:putative membrane protein